MRSDDVLREQINAVNYLTGLSGFVIEKDYYLTQILLMISAINHEYLDVIFQGGTSLSKAYGIVHRMSEDCDFRLIFKREESNLFSKALTQRILRDFRHSVIEKIQQASPFHYEVVQDSIKNHDGGRFFSMRVSYPSAYPGVVGVKPYLALEFSFDEVSLAPVVKPITTLIQKFLGDHVAHPVFFLKSLAIEETAAEKWVALTRRIATSRYRNEYYDAHLVRHLYDLYHIDQLGMMSQVFFDLTIKKVLKDRLVYKNHNIKYFTNPVDEIRESLNHLTESRLWKKNWDEFMMSMVFSNEKPSYAEALRHMQVKSERILVDLAKC